MAKPDPNTLSMRRSKCEKDLLINYPSNPDGHLLHTRLNAPRFDGSNELPSFVSELEARGYDITTLRFSVKRKAKKPEVRDLVTPGVAQCFDD